MKTKPLLFLCNPSIAIHRPALSITSSFARFPRPTFSTRRSPSLRQSCVCATQPPSNHPSAPNLPSGPSPGPHMRQPTEDSTITVGPWRLRLSPRLLLSMVPCLWASFVICAKLLYVLPHTLPPPAFNMLRLMVSVLFFTPVLRAEARALRADRTYLRHFRPGMEVGVLVAVANIFQIIGLRYTQASRAAFLNQLSTIFVPLSAAAMGFEKLTTRVVIGALAALLGIALLTIPVSAPVLLTVDPMSRFGDFLEFISAVFTSAYVIRMAFHTQSLPAKRLIPLAGIKVATQACISVVWLTLSIVLPHIRNCIQSAFGRSVTVHQPRTLAAMAAYLTPTVLMYNTLLVLWAAVMVSAGTSWLQTKGQVGASASEAAILFASQPLWASIFAALLLKERMTLAGMVGALMIVFGAVVSSTSGDKEKTPA